MTSVEREGGAPSPESGAPPATMRLRALLVPVYLPSLLFAIGQGAVIPIIPLLAREVGASVAAAGLVVALRGIGTMSFDVPAGSLVGRYGERRTVVFGTILLVVAAIGCMRADQPGAVAAFVFVMGCGWSVWLLARLSYVSNAVPVLARGRALSTLGGVNRMGNFIGPFVGAVAIAIGGIQAVFLLQALMAVIACIILLAAPVPADDEETSDRAGRAMHGPVPVRSIVSDHGRVFGTAGLAGSLISMLRASRQVILPLWGAAIGLGPTHIAVVFGLSAALDMLLFYPSGVITDRWGRKAAAIPCLAMLSAGLIILPATSSAPSFLLVALLLGAGNGVGTGIVMTLGADFSPVRGRAEFLGVWRLVTDVGQAGGPLLIAGATAALSLGFASAAVGLLGLTGVGIVVRFVPETLKR